MNLFTIAFARISSCNSFLRQIYVKSSSNIEQEKVSVSVITAMTRQKY